MNGYHLLLFIYFFQNTDRPSNQPKPNPPTNHPTPPQKTKQKPAQPPVAPAPAPKPQRKGEEELKAELGGFDGRWCLGYGWTFPRGLIEEVCVCGCLIVCFWGCM